MPCLLCDGGPLLPVLRIAGVPALCNALYDDPDDARRAPSGPVDLRVCTSCGAGRNVAFDTEVIAYTGDYENSLHFSPSFQGFATELARRLGADFHLAGGKVLEIGCGKGEFLSLLCEVAGCSGTGYDPTFVGTPPPGAPFTVEPSLFPSAPGNLQADLVVCRHVLEHLDDPRAMLRTLRVALGATSSTPSYMEVPDGRYMFATPALWDVIYEHPWYYSAPALQHLFETTGFEVTRCQSTFGGQYLSIEARPGTGERDRRQERADQVASVVEAATAFGASFQDAVDRWSQELPERAAAGDPVVVWGAGSKGVTFLNVVPEAAAHVAAAVDVNPRKRGRFVAGSGHRIVDPEGLASINPALVVVMNPLYVDEIGAQLAAAGVRARLEAV